MTGHDLGKLVDEQFAQIEKLSGSKGKEYTRESEDKLANFKRAGEALNLDPEKVLFVYLSKHWDAITWFVANQKWNEPRHHLSEPIEGRIDDAILYLILLKGLLQDRRIASPGGGPGTPGPTLDAVFGGGGIRPI